MYGEGIKVETKRNFSCDGESSEVEDTVHGDTVEAVSAEEVGDEIWKVYFSTTFQNKY